MTSKFKFALLLVLVVFQSCRMCSHHRDYDTYSIEYSDDSLYYEESGYNDDSENEKRAVEWSNLQDVGYPVIADSIPSIFIERYCYSESYNGRTLQPNWVMWQLKDEHIMQKKEGVWNDFRDDLELPSDIRASVDDYELSGYDKGHMCPGGDCNWDDIGRDETYIMSNICPQNPNLNRGDWKEIELACRKWAKQYGNIYIVCGPVFFKSQQHVLIGANQVPVPEAFFKVVLCIDSDTPKGIGFICRNTDGNRKKDFYVNSIKQVERVTGYKFFPNLNDSVKSVTFDMDDINEW